MRMSSSKRLGAMSRPTATMSGVGLRGPEGVKRASMPGGTTLILSGLNRR
jgi:hypothetical protein